MCVCVFVYVYRIAGEEGGVDGERMEGGWSVREG